MTKVRIRPVGSVMVFLQYGSDGKTGVMISLNIPRGQRQVTGAPAPAFNLGKTLPEKYGASIHRTISDFFQRGFFYHS
jgi:hypothetical protein